MASECLHLSVHARACVHSPMEAEAETFWQKETAPPQAEQLHRRFSVILQQVRRRFFLAPPPPVGLLVLVLPGRTAQLCVETSAPMSCSVVGLSCVHHIVASATTI